MRKTNKRASRHVASAAAFLVLRPLVPPADHPVSALLARTALLRGHPRGEQLPVGSWRHQLRMEHVDDEDGARRAVALVGNPHLVLPHSGRAR